MSLSTNEQTQNSQEFLNKVDIPACPGCVRGIRMCYNTPCMGSVDDLEKIIDAGYAKNLMLDWWTGTGDRTDKQSQEIRKLTRRENPFVNDVFYLVPAIVGVEGKKTPYSRNGKCNLLINNQCSLHSLNLKPIQGRMSCCKVDRVYLDEEGKEQDLDERFPILHTWNTERGQKLIERWKKLVDYDESNQEENKRGRIPKTIPDLIEGLLGMIEIMSHEHLNVDGCPPEPEDPHPDPTVITYERKW